MVSEEKTHLFSCNVTWKLLKSHVRQILAQNGTSHLVINWQHLELLNCSNPVKMRKGLYARLKNWEIMDLILWWCHDKGRFMLFWPTSSGRCMEPERCWWREAFCWFFQKNRQKSVSSGTLIGLLGFAVTKLRPKNYNLFYNYLN